MAVLYGRAGRLTAKNGGFRPGQVTQDLQTATDTVVRPDQDARIRGRRKQVLHLLYTVQHTMLRV